MGRGMRLGRVAGVEVRADWSLLVIAGLIVFSLAVDVFPGSVKGTPTWLEWVLAGATTLVFLASLLAHELAHSVVAQKHGIAVEGITLWLFGGVSQLKGEVATPGDAMRITAVGPAVSVILGALFLGLGEALSAAGVANVFVLVPLWLGGMNLLLGLFNLIPAFPLDGGRILQAVLWRRSGDRGEATLRAAWSGRSFGILMIALGVIAFFVYDTLTGMWLAFLGWFLMTAAGAEATQTRMGSLLRGLRVRDIMATDPVVVPGWITIDSFLHDFALASRHSCFPVRDWTGGIVGLISLRHLATIPRDHRLVVRVQDVVTPLSRVPTVGPDDPITDLSLRMRASLESRALVFERGQLVGIVSPSDIGRAVHLGELTRTSRAA